MKRKNKKKLRFVKILQSERLLGSYIVHYVNDVSMFGSTSQKTDTSKVTPKLSVSHDIYNNVTVQIIRNRNN